MVLAPRAEPRDLAFVTEARGSGTGATSKQTQFCFWLYLLVA